MHCPADARAELTVPVDASPARMLRRFAQGRIDPTMRISSTWVLRAIRTGAGPATVLYRMSEDGPVDDPPPAAAGQGSLSGSLPGTHRVTVEAWGPGADLAVSDAPGALGLRDRPEVLEALLSVPHPHERALAPLRHGRPLPRLGTAHSLVELLVPTILGQKVQTVAAHRSYRFLCQRFGGEAPGPHDLLLPPDPDRLAEAGYHHLHPANVERKRAEAILVACRRRTSIDRLPALHRGSGAAVRTALESLPGIGPWSSALVTLHGCGDPDAVVVGDFHLPHMVAWALAGEPRATDGRMLELLAPFAGQRARVQLLTGRAATRPPRRGPKLSIRDIRTQ